MPGRSPAHMTGQRGYRPLMSCHSTAPLLAMLRLVGVVAPSLLGIACGGDPYGTRTTAWDASSESPSTPPSAPPAAEPTGEKKKLTAAEVAAAATSADACQASARDHYQRDVKRGLTLLKACATRDDFLELSWLLTGPWKKDLADDEGLQLVLAEVIARRGGFVEADTHACRKAGILIYDVNTALDRIDRLVGKLVLARATVVGVAREKTDHGNVQIATFAESTWADEVEEEGAVPPPLHELNPRTGRNVFARVEPGEDRLVQKRQVVVALRLEERKESGDDPSVIGALAGIWRAAPTLHDRGSPRE